MTLYALILFLHLTGVVALFLAFGIEWAAISFLGKATSPRKRRRGCGSAASRRSSTALRFSW